MNCPIHLLYYIKTDNTNERTYNNSVSHTLGQSIRRNQILRNFISWNDRTLKIYWTSSKSNFQHKELVVYDNPDLHDDPAINRHRASDRDFVAVLIFRFRHIEYRED